MDPLLFIIFLEILAVAIRVHPGIRGVSGGDKEHKLLLYADDILAAISADVPTTSDGHHPIIFKTVRLLYTINWKKSEAMPLSKFCLPFMVEKFNFKWVCKGMKCLGVKLSQDAREW